MIRNSRAGFTIPEVLLAIVMLTVGMLAMMGTSAAATKLISRGRRVTVATQVAAAVMDSLRLKSNEDLVACTDLSASATGYTKQGVTVTWQVGSYVAGTRTGSRQVSVIADYRATFNSAADTLITVFKCDI